MPTLSSLAKEGILFTRAFESKNLARSEPGAMELLINDYKDWTQTFQPPVKWSRDRWEEIAFQ